MTFYFLWISDMDLRAQALQEWLTTYCKLPGFDMVPMQGDASFRRYFRVYVPDGSYVAMDAPPTKENCIPYILIGNALRTLGINTPEVMMSDTEQGFLLLRDFGERLYLNELNLNNAEDLYRRALDTLAVLQTCSNVEGWTIPNFTTEFMRNELNLFKEWFLEKHLKITVSSELQKDLDACFDFLVTSAANQKQVFMHRDFISTNLMVLPSDNVGVLDFQDAFIGPVTYDLVSLLRDCYVTWPDALVTKLVLEYQQKINLLSVSPDEFFRWFDLMGLQRHLKALLTFSRKFHRDQNPNYLQHIPRTLEYVAKISALYPECTALRNLILDQVLICVA